MEGFRDYGFEYRHQGKMWGIHIKATGREDAEARLKALAWAEYVGELHEVIRADSLRAPFVPLIVWWRNLFAKQSQ